MEPLCVVPLCFSSALKSWHPMENYSKPANVEERNANRNSFGSRCGQDIGYSYPACLEEPVGRRDEFHDSSFFVSIQT